MPRGRRERERERARERESERARERESERARERERERERERARARERESERARERESERARERERGRQASSQQRRKGGVHGRGGLRTSPTRGAGNPTQGRADAVVNACETRAQTRRGGARRHHAGLGIQLGQTEDVGAPPRRRNPPAGASTKPSGSNQGGKSTHANASRRPVAATSPRLARAPSHTPSYIPQRNPCTKSKGGGKPPNTTTRCARPATSEDEAHRKGDPSSFVQGNDPPKHKHATAASASSSASPPQAPKAAQFPAIRPGGMLPRRQTRAEATPNAWHSGSQQPTQLTLLQFSSECSRSWLATPRKATRRATLK